MWTSNKKLTFCNLFIILTSVDSLPSSEIRIGSNCFDANLRGSNGLHELYTPYEWEKEKKITKVIKKEKFRNFACWKEKASLLRLIIS
jgi:hypothetical protein